MTKFARLIIAIFLLLAIVPCEAQAEQGISASHTVDIDFPTAMIFNISAEGPTDIDRVILSYRVNRISTAKVTSLVLVKFDPAPTMEASWKWDMRKSGLPPGAEVQYSWRIEDISGRELETDWEAVRFDDDSHLWHSLTEDKVTLLWYRGEQGFSRELIDAAHEALERLASDTGAYLERGVQLYIYADSWELREAMVYPQDWVGGVAFTEFGIVAIGVAPEDLAWGKRTIKHELAHLVTYQMTANPYGDIPTWLNEGLSMYAEGELEPSLARLLSEAVSEDSLVSVQTLSSEFPADPQAAYLAYAESYGLVEFLFESYGREEILRLLGTFKRGSSYDDALRQVYGFDTAGLNDVWRASLGLGPSSELPTDPVGQKASPSPTPGAGFLGCGAARAESAHGGVALFGALGLLLLPGLGEAVRLKVRRGKR